MCGTPIVSGIAGGLVLGCWGWRARRARAAATAPAAASAPPMRRAVSRPREVLPAPVAAPPTGVTVEPMPPLAEPVAPVAPVAPVVVSGRTVRVVGL